MKRFKIVFALFVCSLLMMPGVANSISKKRILKSVKSIQLGSGYISNFELMYDHALNEVWVTYYYEGDPMYVTYNIWGNGLINGSASASDYIGNSNVYVSYRFADDDLFCSGDVEGEAIGDNGAYGSNSMSFEWPDCCEECEE